VILLVVKTLDRYVIATMDNPTMYYKRLTNGEHSFVENIEYATNFLSRKTANMYKNFFYEDTRLIDKELLIVPLKINYELVEEKYD